MRFWLALTSPVWLWLLYALVTLGFTGVLYSMLGFAFLAAVPCAFLLLGWLAMAAPEWLIGGAATAIVVAWLWL